jgi:hypothetical protein
MYVKIEPYNYNLIDLMIVIRSSTNYYYDGNAKNINYVKFNRLLEIIEKDDKYSFVDLISDEISCLSQELLNKPCDNSYVANLINIFTVYLSVVRYEDPLIKIISVEELLFDEENESEDIPLLVLEEEKDFLEEPFDEDTDFSEFEFEDEDLKLSKAGESWIRKPKAND